VRILFIPDCPLHPSIKTRSEELARQIANKHFVYYLSWGIKDVGNPLTKLFFRIRQRFVSKSEFSCGELEVITVPHSDFGILKAPFNSEIILEKNRQFNKKILKKIVKEKNVDAIVSQSHRIWDVTYLKVPFLYDVSDIPYDGKFKGFMKRQIVHASKLTCISHFIKREIKKQLNLNATVVPNGVNLKEFRGVENRESAKKQATIIGLIGNHGWWSGLDFFLDVFKKIEDKFQLWVVGGGSEIPKAIKKAKKEKIKNVKFFGPIPKDHVLEYFNAIDLGAVPFEKTVFTEAALLIKILEYTAARKYVLTTDLEELRLLKLSNIVLRPRNEALWADTIYDLKDRKWNPQWNREIKAYDWKVLSEKILSLLKKI